MTLDLGKYKTGNPCGKCSGTLRYSIGNQCVACQAVIKEKQMADRRLSESRENWKTKMEGVNYE